MCVSSRQTGAPQFKNPLAPTQSVIPPIVLNLAPDKCLFSCLQLACFAHPAKPHRHLPAADKTNPVAAQTSGSRWPLELPEEDSPRAAEPLSPARSVPSAELPRSPPLLGGGPRIIASGWPHAVGGFCLQTCPGRRNKPIVC